jgi:nitrous oxide reductase
MRSSARWLLIVASAVVVVVLFVLLQPGGSDEGLQPERTIVEVTFRDGSVEGPTEFTLTQGERVRILVHADVSDEVHLHGYDLHADVTPTEPARIDFVADAAGVFECELEGAGTLLFRLEIRP